ncbi:MAG: DUF2974 domain-containing protein [Clostridia bacterium]|nr:DUF2974 domain-containing protein [Clostridia bacterium]
MANILDYIEWRGDLPIKDVPLSEADALVFSRAAYMPLEGLLGESDGPVPLGELYTALAEQFASGEKQQLIEGDEKLCRLMARAPRYANIGAAHYVNIVDEFSEKQFSAVTFVLPDGICVAFRGTDGTVLGWKEDFNMAFSDVVPAQMDAVKYLERSAHVFDGSIRVTGHSKGGNLAIYASAFCDPETKQRIIAVRSHDGPGFSDKIANTEEYMQTMPLVRTFLPQSSVIGMLMVHREETVIVKSTEHALMQHDLYSWCVRRGGFERVEELTDMSRFVDDTLKRWVCEMPVAERGKMVEAVFKVIGTGGTSAIKDIMAGTHSITMVRAYAALDPESKRVVSDGLRILRECASAAEARRKASKAAKV